MITINLHEKSIRMNHTEDDYKTLKNLWKVNEDLNKYAFPIVGYVDETGFTDGVRYEANEDWTVNFNV